MSDIPSFASIYGGVFIACIGGFAALFFIKGLIESVKMSREADGKSDSYKKIVRADLSEIEALRKVAVAASDLRNAALIVHGLSTPGSKNIEDNGMAWAAVLACSDALFKALSDAGYGDK